MGPEELYLGEEAVVGTVVQAEVQSEISLMQAELVEARGRKAIPVNTESPKRSLEVIQEHIKCSLNTHTRRASGW